MRNRIRVWKGDITTLAVDVIVNAANTGLLGGGGVDGAIHAAAGPELLQECMRLGGCPTGEARLTKGYRLPAKRIIHTVGPVWRGGQHGEESLLASCYQSSLALATANRLETIAFPAISPGAYGYPIERAARVAIREIITYLQEHVLPREVTLVAYSGSSYQLYDRVLRTALDELRASDKRGVPL